MEETSCDRASLVRLEGKVRITALYKQNYRAEELCLPTLLLPLRVKQPVVFAAAAPSIHGLVSYFM